MFTNFVPPMAGSGLVWDTSTLIDDGTLRVSMAPQPQITTIVVSNGDLVFSGTNGVPRAPYFVLTATNVALPVGQWTRLATNAFGSNGEFLFSMPPDGGQRFYRLQLP
jgi:hypothetical protein